MRIILFFVVVFFAVNARGDFEKEVASFRQTLGEFVKADTSNPPGNENRIVEIVAKRLKDAGIPYETFEFAPGRGGIVARLKAEGAKEKPLLMLAHIDVVPAANQTWTTEPHVVTEREGFLYGRGVSDDLGMASLELETFLKLKREGKSLRRDVILALTGDEESGGLGIRWLIDKKPELIDASIALNEGAGPILGDNGKVKLMGLQVAEKNYADFEVTAKGTTGHSSVPLPDNAIYRLARALARFGDGDMPYRMIPVTRAYFEKRAALEEPKLAAAMRVVAKAKGALPKAAMKEIEKDPALAANLRTTCVATMLEGGTKVNALPPTAKAVINCRVLPEETMAATQSAIVKRLGDAALEVKIVEDLGVAKASPETGEVPAAVAKVVAKVWPGAPVIPTMSRGATDSRYLRIKGCESYGVDPFALTEADERRAHGIDERIPVAAIAPAFAFFEGLVVELAGK